MKQKTICTTKNTQMYISKTKVPHKCIQKLLTFPYSRCFKKFNTNLIIYLF